MLITLQVNASIPVLLLLLLILRPEDVLKFVQKAILVRLIILACLNALFPIMRIHWIVCVSLLVLLLQIYLLKIPQPLVSLIALSWLIPMLIETTTYVWATVLEPMNTCLISKQSALVYALKVNSCKIQQKDVKLFVLLDSLNLLLDIVCKGASETLRLMDTIRFATTNAWILALLCLQITQLICVFLLAPWPNHLFLILCLETV